jgi:hypothetical protein
MIPVIYEIGKITYPLLNVVCGWKILDSPNLVCLKKEIAIEKLKGADKILCRFDPIGTHQHWKGSVNVHMFIKRVEPGYCSWHSGLICGLDHPGSIAGKVKGLCLVQNLGWNSVVSIVMLWAGQSRCQIPLGMRFSTTVQNGPGTYSASRVPGHSQEYSSWGMWLTTHPI